MSDPELELPLIDYLVIEFPGGRITGDGLSLLTRFVHEEVIRLLDLVLVRKQADGSVVWLTLEDLGDDVVPGVFDSARPHLLDDLTVAVAAQAVEVGCLAAVLVYESCWTADLAAALTGEGARLVDIRHVPADAVRAAEDQGRTP